MTDHALLGGGDEPARVPGHGPIPAWLARRLVREADKAWVRRLFVSPTTGELVAMSSRRRHFPGKLRDFLVLRDEVCRTPWCDAPVRHVDHPQPHARGGSTTSDNAQGLCENCNYVKEAPGWSATAEGSSVTTWSPSAQVHLTRRRPRRAGGRDPSSSSSTASRTCARPCRPPEPSRSPERVSSGLDPGDVRRPLVGRHVVGVAARVAVDRLAHDVAVPGVLRGLGDHPHQQVAEGGVAAALVPPRDPGRCVERRSWRSRCRSAPRPCGTRRGAAPGSRRRWPTCRPPPTPSRPRSTEGSAGPAARHCRRGSRARSRSGA